jgi:hypothetical protein
MTAAETRTCTFNSSTTSPGVCAAACIGNTAVFYNDNRKKARASGNQIDNYRNGILAYYSYLSGPPTYTFGVGTNTISSSGTGACDQAIQMQDASNNFTSTATYTIANNQISSVTNGISISGITKGVRTSNNNISLLFPNLYTQYGIAYTGSGSGAVDNNTVTSVSSATTNALVRAVYMESTPSGTNTCNYVDNVGQGFVYNNNCVQSQRGWTNNTMNNCHDGFYTEYNGHIGTQGQSTKASGNTWTGSYNNSQTMTDPITGTLSAAFNSTLWVNTGSHDKSFKQSNNW